MRFLRKIAAFVEIDKRNVSIFDKFGKKYGLKFTIGCDIIVSTVSCEAFGIERNRLAEELWRIP